MQEQSIYTPLITELLDVFGKRLKTAVLFSHPLGISRSESTEIVKKVQGRLTCFNRYCVFFVFPGNLQYIQQTS